MRWRLTTFVLAASLVTCAVAAPAPGLAQAAASPAAEALYAYNTGAVLTVGQTAGRGARIRTESDYGTGGQRWIFGSHGTISPEENQKLCLNVRVIKHRLSSQLNLWACNGSSRERFATRTPTAHSPVFFIASRATRRKLCVSFEIAGDGAQQYLTGSGVSLRSCGNSIRDAFSTANLRGVAASVGMNDWERALNANQDSKPGTAVTASYGSMQLGQQWESTASGSYASLSPVYDLSQCLTVSGAQRDRAPLVITRCNGSAAQQFIGIGVLDGDPARYYLVSASARFCLSTVARKTAVKSGYPTRSVVLLTCSGTSSGGTWLADLNVPSTMAYQFQQFYAVVNGWSGLVPAMATNGGGSGSPTSLAQSMTAAQVWTDVNPATMTPGNADGTISIRPLYDLDLCLTVPAANYTAGVQLQAQKCDGALDQEFGRQDSTFNGGAADVFSPSSNGSLCISYDGTLAGGDKVELEACGGQVNQAWEGWDAWFDWAG
jgi:hypothetical protein